MWRAFRHWALRNTEYEWSEVTLSKAAADDPTRDEALYHIWEKGECSSLLVSPLLFCILFSPLTSLSSLTSLPLTSNGQA